MIYLINYLLFKNVFIYIYIYSDNDDNDSNIYYCKCYMII